MGRTGVATEALTIAYDTAALPIWDDIQGTDLGVSYVQDVRVVGKLAIAAGFHADDYGSLRPPRSSERSSFGVRAGA